MSEIPPIMLTPGLRLVDITYDEDGCIRMKFFASATSKVREVTVIIMTDQPTRVEYGYAIWDRTTSTVVTYRGPYGDPRRDELGPMFGV